MKRICIIGNSHITALKSAWDNLQTEFPDIQITFFGAFLPLLKSGGLVVSKGCLRPRGAELRESFVQTSGGLPDISGQYDAYLTCGLRFGIDGMEALCLRYRAEAHVRDDRRPVSDAFYLTCIKVLLNATASVEIVRFLQQITAAPVWVLPQPMPGEERTGTAVDRLDEVGDDQTVRNALIEAMLQVAKENHFTLLHQPEVTLSRPLKTKSIYTRGAHILSGGMNKPFPREDHVHMNADYGCLVMRPWIATLSQAAPTS